MNIFETPKPLLDVNEMETNFHLPFDGFTKEAHPEVIKWNFTFQMIRILRPIKEKYSLLTDFTQQFFSLCVLCVCQEYKKAVEKLRQAYFSDASNVAEIKQRNIALLSELNFNYGILKAIVFQSNAIHKATNDIVPRNTFLFR